MLVGGKSLVLYKYVAADNKIAPETKRPIPNIHSRNASAVISRSRYGEEPWSPSTNVSITDGYPKYHS